MTKKKLNIFEMLVGAFLYSVGYALLLDSAGFIEKEKKIKDTLSENDRQHKG